MTILPFPRRGSASFACAFESRQSGGRGKLPVRRRRRSCGRESPVCGLTGELHVRRGRKQNHRRPAFRLRPCAAAAAFASAFFGRRRRGHWSGGSAATANAARDRPAFRFRFCSCLRSVRREVSCRLRPARIASTGSFRSGFCGASSFSAAFGGGKIDGGIGASLIAGPIFAGDLTPSPSIDFFRSSDWWSDPL